MRYGKGEHNCLFRERFGLYRLALHALELTFDHPATGERIPGVLPFAPMTAPTPPSILQAFRTVTRTGVTYATKEATARGYRTGDPEWPEIGPLREAPPRGEAIAIDPTDHYYAPVAGVWELGEAVASLYNQLIPGASLEFWERARSSKLSRAPVLRWRRAAAV